MKISIKPSIHVSLGNQINFTYGIDVCISDDRLNVSCDERVGILSPGVEDSILVVFMILSCIIESVVND